MDKRIEIYTIVVNWNRKQDTLECLKWLSTQVLVRVRIVLVDNGSTDDSVAVIRECYPSVTIIQLEKNLGFAGGYNVGIKWAIENGAQYIFIVNNDTLSDDNLLFTLVSNDHPGIGILSPIIYNAFSPAKLWSQGGQINKILLEMSDNHGRNKPIPSTIEDRDFLSGCAMLIKTEVFEKIGLFDERFYLYYEDLDFCLRVKHGGFRLVIVPQASLFHKISQSSGGSNSVQERYYMTYSNALFIKKHMRFWQAPFILSYRFLSAIRWSLRLILLKKWGSLYAYWRGLLKGWIFG